MVVSKHMSWTILGLLKAPAADGEDILIFQPQDKESQIRRSLGDFLASVCTACEARNHKKISSRILPNLSQIFFVRLLSKCRRASFLCSAKYIPGMFPLQMFCGRFAKGYFGNGYFEFQCEERCTFFRGLAGHLFFCRRGPAFFVPFSS